MKKKIMRHWQLYFIILLPLIYLFVFRYMPMLGSQIAFRNYNFKDGPWTVSYTHLYLIFMVNSLTAARYRENIAANLEQSCLLMEQRIADVYKRQSGSSNKVLKNLKSCENDSRHPRCYIERCNQNKNSLSS